MADPDVLLNELNEIHEYYYEGERRLKDLIDRLDRLRENVNGEDWDEDDFREWEDVKILTERERRMTRSGRWR